jgi:hypothetical protein
MPKTKKIDWALEASKLLSDDIQLTVPLHVAPGEGTKAAAFFRKYYKADKKAGLPGLSSVGDKLSPHLDEEIDSLVEEAANANGVYLSTHDPKTDTSKLDRAKFLLDEIGGALEFLFDDGKQDENDAALGAVLSAHKSDPFTPDALALALDDYAHLAKEHAKELDGLGDFDADLIPEAFALAKELRAMPPASPAAAAASKIALGQRNRLLQLLDIRVRQVRACARWVFRNHPAVVQEATSVYQRKRRVEAQRAAKKAKDKPATTPATPA